ncbi:hypothetical protein [Kitasatospora sp. NPDC015120]|uniref:hypothetical protein n=1 Tax=Kitasatospora sp. NPDC015120 TaxID=3364023 RepID=UPI0036F4AC7E
MTHTPSPDLSAPLREQLAYVPEHHLPAVVSQIVGHNLPPAQVHAAGALVEHGITLAWANRLPGFNVIDLGQYRQLARHFHYPELFHKAIHQGGDLRNVTVLATVTGICILNNGHLHPRATDRSS